MTKLELLEAELATALAVVQDCRSHLRDEKNRLRGIKVGEERILRLRRILANIERGRLAEEYHDQGYTYKAIALYQGISVTKLDGNRRHYARSLWHPERYAELKVEAYPDE